MNPSDYQDNNDVRLLSLMSEGNQLAFRQIYLRYWEKLYPYARNILNDDGLTEDVLHEVFTNIWAKRSETKIENLKSYLFNAVRNRSLVTIRNDRFTEFDEFLIGELVLPAEVEQEFDKVDTVSAIERAAKGLPSRCRTIFYMNKFQHYSTNEIAAHFNISHRTVENQISLAIKHLRAELGTTMFIVMLFL
ncbi:MAG: RNA polymerase sigma-70 factor [Bacteroidota bacterium]